jgi:hypothetical protein
MGITARALLIAIIFRAYGDVPHFAAPIWLSADCASCWRSQAGDFAIFSCGIAADRGIQLSRKISEGGTFHAKK